MGSLPLTPCLGLQVVGQEVQNKRPLDNSSIAKQPRPQVVQMVKRLPTMQETWVQSLGREDLLEKAMAPYSSILAWKIPRMEEPGSLQSMRLQRVRHD